MPDHAISVLAEGAPDLLHRITGLCRRRGFVIEALTFGAAERPDLVRVVLRLRGSGQSRGQIVDQFDKLVGVLHVAEPDV